MTYLLEGLKSSSQGIAVEEIILIHYLASHGSYAHFATTLRLSLGQECHINTNTNSNLQRQKNLALR